nr:MAG TPA: hypothetical protein [Caudoviricetes sp.]
MTAGKNSKNNAHQPAHNQPRPRKWPGYFHVQIKLEG